MSMALAAPELAEEVEQELLPCTASAQQAALLHRLGGASCSKLVCRGAVTAAVLALLFCMLTRPRLELASAPARLELAQKTRQRSTTSYVPACLGDPQSWTSEYGPCGTYAKKSLDRNFLSCSVDKGVNDGLLARQVCAECEICTTPKATLAPECASTGEDIWSPKWSSRPVFCCDQNKALKCDGRMGEFCGECPTSKTTATTTTTTTTTTTIMTTSMAASTTITTEERSLGSVSYRTGHQEQS